MNILINKPQDVVIICVLTIVNTFLQNRIIIKLLKVEEKNEYKLLLIQSIYLIIEKIFFNNNLWILINIFIELFLYNKFLNLKGEKLFISELINFTIICTEKMMGIFEIELYSGLIIRIIIYLYQKNKNFIVKNCINEKVKNKIGAISILSMMLISFVQIRILNNINTIEMYLFLLIYFFIIAYLIILIKNILSKLIEFDDKIIIENLEQSNKRLQENYDNVRAFKHDFNNIMQGIGGYIVAKDLDGLDKMYKSIVKECQEINEKQSINGEIINNPAILNLINNKIELAEKNGIKIKLEVYINLNTLKVSSYDLCRILGILIDNAIEATNGCENKIITIKFLKDKIYNRNLIVIENPYKNYLIDIKKIYEKGFSSKMDKVSHGLGLWKVKQILKRNKNIQIYTSRDKLFKQQLEIY